jgi:hypothetical protein
MKFAVGLSRHAGAPLDQDDRQQVSHLGVEGPDVGGRMESPNPSNLRDFFDRKPRMGTEGSGSEKF